MAQKVVNGTFETSEAKGFSWKIGWREHTDRCEVTMIPLHVVKTVM